MTHRGGEKSGFADPGHWRVAVVFGSTMFSRGSAASGAIKNFRCR